MKTSNITDERECWFHKPENIVHLLTEIQYRQCVSHIR